MKCAYASFALLFGTAAALEIRSGEQQQDPSNVGVALPPDPSNVELPDVPKPLDALPAVSDILMPATNTMSGISSQAARLQKQIQALATESTMRMDNEHKIFDKKLQDQEEENRELAKNNSHLAKDIMKMNKTNSDLLNNAAKLQKGNADRRKVLKLLKEHLETSTGFMADAYASTDDSSAAELEVLRSGGQQSQTAMPISLLSISEAEGVEHDESGDPEIKKAEAAAGTPNQEAEAIVTKLQDGVKEMRQQGSASEDKLKMLFVEHFKAGNARHKALLSQNKVLQSTLENMKNYAERLLEANQHLKATQAKLDTQLHDGSVFLKRMGDIAGKKPEKSVQELEALQSKLKAVQAGLQSK